MNLENEKIKISEIIERLSNRNNEDSLELDALKDEYDKNYKNYKNKDLMFIIMLPVSQLLPIIINMPLLGLLLVIYLSAIYWPSISKIKTKLHYLDEKINDCLEKSLDNAQLLLSYQNKLDDVLKQLQEEELKSFKNYNSIINFSKEEETTFQENTTYDEIIDYNKGYSRKLKK